MTQPVSITVDSEEPEADNRTLSPLSDEPKRNSDPNDSLTDTDSEEDEDSKKSPEQQQFEYRQKWNAFPSVAQTMTQTTAQHNTRPNITRFQQHVASLEASPQRKFPSIPRPQTPSPLPFESSYQQKSVVIPTNVKDTKAFEKKNALKRSSSFQLLHHGKMKPQPPVTAVQPPSPPTRLNNSISSHGTIRTYQYIMNTVTRKNWGNPVNPLQSRLFHIRGQSIDLQHPPRVHYPVLVYTLADLAVKGTIELSYWPIREEKALQSNAPRGVTTWHFVCYMSLTPTQDGQSAGTMVCEWLHHRTHQISDKRCLAEQNGVVMEMRLFRNANLLKFTPREAIQTVSASAMQEKAQHWQYLDFLVSHLDQQTSQTLNFLANVHITTVAYVPF